MKTVGRWVKYHQCSCGDLFPHDFGGKGMTREESELFLQQLLEQSWGGSIDNTQGLVWGNLFPPRTETHSARLYKKRRRGSRGRGRSCTKK